uniref:B-like cyclin n=1 Tax=Kalanchoe fedtschenkoi TaxID=63787 RepID=A0A7N0TT11_KALFE
MKKETSIIASAGVPVATGRITRAKAAALKENVGALKGKVNVLKDPRRPPRPPLSKATSSGKYSATATLGKRKAVLQDVSNVCCRSSSYASADTIRNIKKTKKEEDVKVVAAVPYISVENRHRKAGLNTNTETTMKTELGPESELINFSTTLDHKPDKFVTGSSTNQRVQTSKKPLLPRSTVLKARKSNPPQKLKKSNDPGISDLDSNHKDPQLCSLYAPEIYNHLRVAELYRRPNSDFMETKQRDISQSMRGILIDWLVEVSEEYKLVPDTLYLTVYHIDWFLSNNFIERQKLQLLGITCMLLASKFEEIYAPRVENFCLVTDNTYTKEEVLKMETQVLSSVNFQLYTPTVKSFLRRYVRAAQASYESPSLELEYLADYLAELTLVEYNFLKFLPSTIAASAVFLAIWTLDQSAHPWNAALEYYTLYKSSDLKSSVLALRDLQLNTNNCPLHVIRAKYSQQKFKSVAALFSPKLPEKLF